MFKGLSTLGRIYVVVITIAAVSFGVAAISLSASSSAKDAHIASIEASLASINKKMEEEEARKAQAREATKAFFGGGKPPVEDQDGGKSYSPTLRRSTSFD